MLIRGPNITPGYWNKPEATADAFVDGWLKTGDAARFDDEGFIYIVDRWKDMYISGGENVYPAEVENVLYQLEQVAEAAIIGVPDDRWGDGKGSAGVETRADLMQTPYRTLPGNLAKFKVPQALNLLTLPRNARARC